MSKRQLQQLAVLLGILLLFLLEKTIPSASTTQTAMIPLGVTSSTIQLNAVVMRGVDGDTLEVKLDTQIAEEKVRLLGVNTPESVDPRRQVECFGKEASAFTRALTEGRRVELREDPEADRIDKYGRLLRNVYLEDGTDVNLRLVSEGYAYAYLDFPLNKSRKAELAQAQKQAELKGLGLWSSSTCSGTK